MEKIIQISSGDGPAECCWVVAQVLKFLLEEARNDGIKAEVLQRAPGPENGTLYSAAVVLEGPELEAFLKKWIGTIKWIGQSQFRKDDKRKSWVVGVSEVPMNTGKNLQENDIQYKATRSGGPGGQHVNKVSTAVRATHLPTGLSVMASDSRSQIQNKKQALRRLSQLFQLHELERQKEQLEESWKQQKPIRAGKPIRVFRGTDFKSKTVDKSFKNTRNQMKKDLRKRLDAPD